MTRRNADLIICDCPRHHNGLVHRDTRRRHRQQYDLPDIPDSVPMMSLAALQTTHLSPINSLPSTDPSNESFMTSDAMEIDGNMVHQSEEEERSQPHGSYEIESSNDDEFDDTPVLFESEDNGDYSEDDSGEEDEDDNMYRTESDVESEDDLEDLLNILANMQSNISFLAFINYRNKTANGLGCHLCFILLQISIEYK
jgi:hypothetical protein